jgi:hypothetical protein
MRPVVSKMTLTLTSLVAAIPGLFLAYLMVNVFLSYAGGSSVPGTQTTVPTMFYVLAVLGLLIGATTGLMPAGIMFLGTKSDKADSATKKKGADESESAADASESELEAAELDADEDLDDLDDETETAGTDDFEVVEASESEEIETGDLDEVDVFAEVDDDEFDAFEDLDDEKKK